MRASGGAECRCRAGPAARRPKVAVALLEPRRRRMTGRVAPIVDPKKMPRRQSRRPRVSQEGVRRRTVNAGWPANGTASTYETRRYIRRHRDVAHLEGDAREIQCGPAPVSVLGPPWVMTSRFEIGQIALLTGRRNDPLLNTVEHIREKRIPRDSRERVGADDQHANFAASGQRPEINAVILLRIG
jgi:hypothetical protein